jgi:hypothetical protein
LVKTGNGLNEASTPLTTVTFCGYLGRRRIWAFNRMGSARRDLARMRRGLRFWKLLGTGEGRGFSLRPNFSRYGLLAVWDGAEAADEFFDHSPLMQDYQNHAAEVWTVRMLPLAVHGEWSGCKPFLPVEPVRDVDGPVAVLTRATIRWPRLIAFWRAVPATGRRLDHAAGLMASIGTGEAPFIRPATFSIWRSEEDMRAFAYNTPEHCEVMRRKHQENWYSEELFARFRPIASTGKWNGRDPLAEVLAGVTSGIDVLK